MASEGCDGYYQIARSKSQAPAALGSHGIRRFLGNVSPKMHMAPDRAALW